MSIKRGFTRLVLGGVAAFALMTTQAVPAGATVNAVVGVVQGQGTITPGLDTTPRNQTFTFTSTTITTVGVVNKVPTVLGVSNCTAAGGSVVRDPVTKQVVVKVQETVAAGAGSGTWACTTGPLAGKGGNLVFVRVGAVVAVVLTDKDPRKAAGAGALACIFVPGSVTPPVTTYTLTCAGVLVGAG